MKKYILLIYDYIEYTLIFNISIKSKIERKKIFNSIVKIFWIQSKFDT